MMMLSNKNKFILITIIALAGYFLPSHFSAQASRQINFSAHILNNENKIVANGDYSVSFAIYNSDRKNQTDPVGTPVWQETQKITIANGIINAYLGSVNPVPVNLNFAEGDFFLGVKLNSDSEMVPRKMIGSVPAAADA